MPPRRSSPIKNTCRKCDRTVVVVEIDGIRYELDPEIINVVTLDGTAYMMARRAHGENCVRYQVERDKRVARDKELGRHRNAFAGGVGKRPNGGRREPGQ